MGTPSYMPPEQARGQTDRIDERADVFALGSILCEVLTGKPAFTGRAATEILRKAADGATADALARLDGCGSEAELIGLAKDCLAVEPEGRPRDANVVAERITAYLAGVQERVQAAERERAVAVARAIEERRRRKLQLGLAASLLALTTLGGLGTTYYLQQRQAHAAAVGQVLTVRLRCCATRPGKTPTTRALANRPGGHRPGRDRLGRRRVGSGPARRALGRGQGRRPGGRPRPPAARPLDRHPHAPRPTTPRASRPTPTTPTPSAAPDLDIAALPAAEAAARIKGRPPAVATALVSALDDWASVRRDRREDKAGARRLSETAGGADADPWRHALRTALDQPDGAARLAALKGLVKDARFDELGPVSLDLLGNALTAAGDRAAAEAVLREAQRRHPDDVWVNYNLAGVLAAPGRTDEAVRYYTAARSIRPETAHELAHALEQRGESDEAIEVFRRLCLIRSRNGRHLNCFGKALQDRGRVEESGKILEAAIAALRDEIQLHPDHVSAHFNLGNALNAQGKHDEAVAECRTAIKLRPDFAEAHINLGNALHDQGKLDEAIAECRTAIKLNPDDARAHLNLGNALGAQGKLDEAIAECRTAIKLKPDSAVAHMNLGNGLREQGKDDEAIAEFRTAIKLNPDFAGAHSNLGNLLRDQGKADEAIAECRTAIKLNPGDARVHANLGSALGQHGKLAEAIAELHTAIKLKPDLAEPHDDLGNALAAQGKHDEAIAEHRTAIKLKPDFAEPHCNLGILLQQQGAYAEGLAVLRKGHELGSRTPGWQYPSAEWVANAERAVTAAQTKTAAAPIPTETKTSRTGPLGQDDVKADSLEVLESLHRRAHEIAATKPAEAEPLFRRARGLPQGAGTGRGLDPGLDARPGQHPGPGRPRPRGRVVVVRRPGSRPQAVRSRRSQDRRHHGLTGPEPRPSGQMCRGRARPARVPGHPREGPA